MRLTDLGQDCETDALPELDATVKIYDDRDRDRVAAWNHRFRN
jgi:hypothetical protein